MTEVHRGRMGAEVVLPWAFFNVTVLMRKRDEGRRRARQHTIEIDIGQRGEVRVLCVFGDNPMHREGFSLWDDDGAAQRQRCADLGRFTDVAFGDLFLDEVRPESGTFIVVRRPR